MLSKVYLILFSVMLLASSAYYFTVNSSYQNSIQARVYYLLDNYESAYKLAKSAYDEDNYNKMAFTVMVQSKIAKNYVNYIKQGNIYLKKIDEISSQNKYTKADKIRIKMMCEIMIESFDNLNPSTLTNDILLENSKKVYEKFKKLYKELF